MLPIFMNTKDNAGADDSWCKKVTRSPGSLGRVDGNKGVKGMAKETADCKGSWNRNPGGLEQTSARNGGCAFILLRTVVLVDAEKIL